MGSKNKSVFAIFEGIDGAGKTTIISELKKKLDKDEEIKKAFKEVIYTLEPGGKNQPSCNEIRKILLNDEYLLSPTTQALLFFASRSEHLEKLIRPAIENDSLIVSDRFYLSSIVYQGKGDKDRIKLIENLIDYVSPEIPDLVFYVYISEEEHKKRYLSRSIENQNNHLDGESYEKYKQKKELYENAINNFKKKAGEKTKIIRLNGEEEIQKIVEIVKEEIWKIFYRKSKELLLH